MQYNDLHVHKHVRPVALNRTQLLLMTGKDSVNTQVGLDTQHNFVILYMLMTIVDRLERNPVHLESSLSRSATKEKKTGAGDKKYEQYHGFHMSVSSLKAHQVIR